MKRDERSKRSTLKIESEVCSRIAGVVEFPRDHSLQGCKRASRTRRKPRYSNPLDSAHRPASGCGLTPSWRDETMAHLLFEIRPDVPMHVGCSRRLLRWRRARLFSRISGFIVDMRWTDSFQPWTLPRNSRLGRPRQPEGHMQIEMNDSRKLCLARVLRKYPITLEASRPLLPCAFRSCGATETWGSVPCILWCSASECTWRRPHPLWICPVPGRRVVNCDVILGRYIAAVLDRHILPTDLLRRRLQDTRGFRLHGRVVPYRGNRKVK